DIKKTLKSNLESFKRDTIFLNSFAKRDDELLTSFTECLYNNEIKMRGNNKKVKYENFTNIDFMGPEIKHPEWVQQLNRFYWLKYCAIEYEKNQSDHMARLVYDAINTWIDYWPYYGDRSDIFEWMCCDLFHPMISTPLRLGAGPGHGWIGCLPYFFDHPLFTENFIEKVIKSALWQIEPMIENNKNHSGEHNWRPNELSCLLFLSQVLPGAEKYTEYAIEQLNDAFFAQFENDGSHIEHTTDYHDWMADIFALTFILGVNRPELGININREKILKSLDYGLVGKAPDGRQLGIHDSYAWHMNNPVESIRNLKIRNTIANMCGRQSFEEEYNDVQNFQFDDAQQYFFLNKGKGQQYILETYKETELQKERKIEGGLDPQKICETNGETGPVQMLYFDASKWGGWHTHQSKNALNFFYGNKMLLIDPGSLDYGNSPERWYGKLTPAHNTVNINNLSQSPSSDPVIREYFADDKVVFMVSDYTGGYQDWCGPGSNRPEQGFYGEMSQIVAAHERSFIWIKDKFILVFDSVNMHENDSVLKVSSHWQFLEGEVIHDEQSQSANTCFDDFNILVKKVYSNIDTKSRLYCQETKPMLGYNSKTGGKLSGVTPAPMLSIEAQTDEDFVRIGQIIIPYLGTDFPNVSVTYEKSRYAILFKVFIDDEIYNIASHYFVREIFKTNSAIRSIGDFSSTARAFIKGYKNEKEILNWEYKNSKNH
ncbi:MAG: heparinase II/III family protein, partial [Clostridiales bacterium]|nr:heparinase II/III family protein [Clostridiales bacterium]